MQDIFFPRTSTQSPAHLAPLTDVEIVKMTTLAVAMPGRKESRNLLVKELWSVCPPGNESIPHRKRKIIDSKVPWDIGYVSYYKG